MRFLITSDLHLTDKQEHRYRLQYLDWLTSLTNKLQPGHVAILGDLTDQKDRHSGWLVNAICARLSVLGRAAPLNILFGNHDGPSRDLPYWAFLNSFEGITYYTEATRVGRYVFCPWGCENDGITLVKENDVCLLLMHATVSGAVAENGQRLEGTCSASFLEGVDCKVFSGDIHVPQIVGDVEYVGAPYHVHFGDTFVPRTVLYDTTTRKTAEFRYPSPYLVIWRTDIDRLEVKLPEGCRARVIITSDHEVLPDDFRHAVSTIRTAAKDSNIEIVSCSLERVKAKRVRRAPNARRSDEAVVRTYGSRQKFDESTIATGVELVKEKQ